MSRLFTNGTTDVVTVVPAAEINNLAQRSQMVWVKATSFGGDSDFCLFSRGNATYFDFYPDVGDDGFCYGGVECDAEPTWGSLNSFPVIGDWMHVAMTFDIDTDALVHVYINGVEIDYDQHDVGTPPLGDDSAVNLLIGKFFGTNDFTVDGLLFDYRYYDSVLTESEIAEIVAGGPSVNPGGSSMVIQLTFETDEGATEPDASGNGNTGAITGATFDADNPSFAPSGATAITDVVVNNSLPVERNSPFDVVVTVDAPTSQDTEIELTFTGDGDITGTLIGTILSGETEVTIVDLVIDSIGEDDFFSADGISGDVVTPFDSDLFDVIDSTEPTGDAAGIGEFGGESLSEAFFNPDEMDLIQVVNEGGDVVWNLTFDGVATVNPVSPAPTQKALIGRYQGQSFALAFPNPYQKDIFQIIGQGDNVVFWVDATGISHI